MGAHLLIRTFEYCEKKILEQRVSDQVDQDAYEGGHSYSGNWGVKSGLPTFARLAQPFETVDAAEEYIDKTNDKWGPLTVVPAYEMPDLPRDHKSEALETLKKKVASLNTQLYRFNELHVRADAAKLKSAFKACEHCSSKIHLKSFLVKNLGIDCPVCKGTFLLKPAHVTLQARITKDRDKAVEAVTAQEGKERKRLKIDRRLVWVVGGWCSS
jgi:DNA-directed RNA polymerase subunit RPC12/RpoP